MHPPCLPPPLPRLVVPSAPSLLAPFSPSVPLLTITCSDLPGTSSLPAQAKMCRLLCSTSDLQARSSNSAHRAVNSALAPNSLGSTRDRCLLGSTMLPRPTGLTLARYRPACTADFRAFFRASAPLRTSDGRVPLRQLATATPHCSLEPPLSPGLFSLSAPLGCPDLSVTLLVVGPLTLPWLLPPSIKPWAFVPPVLWASTFSTLQSPPPWFLPLSDTPLLCSPSAPLGVLPPSAPPWFFLPSSGSSPAPHQPPEPPPSLSLCRSVTVRGCAFPEGLRSVTTMFSLALVRFSWTLESSSPFALLSTTLYPSSQVGHAINLKHGGGKNICCCDWYS
ncbi:hypothetical protein PO909_006723 [Leuciscus waleckii]